MGGGAGGAKLNPPFRGLAKLQKGEFMRLNRLNRLKFHKRLGFPDDCRDSQTLGHSHPYQAGQAHCHPLPGEKQAHRIAFGRNR
jgi:hypothetical protein